jgi:hypothetical protein
MTAVNADWSRAFEPMPGVDGVGVWRPASGLRVVIGESHSQATYSEQEEARWGDLRAANPRLHDGGILAVVRVDHSTAAIHCRRERYKRLALQDPPLAPSRGV